MSEFGWLHLSDLHAHLVRGHTQSKYAWQRLIDHLCKHKPQIDVVFFTGDAAFGQTASTPTGTMPSQYIDFSQRIDRLREVLAHDGNPLPKERVFIVPGNHDVNGDAIGDILRNATSDMLRRADLDFANRLIAKADDEWDNFTARLEHYREFLDSAGYARPSHDRSRVLCRSDIEINEIRVSVFQFNTAWMCDTRPSKPGDIFAGLKWQYQHLVAGTPADTLRIAMLHHPPGWLHDPERSDVDKLLKTAFHLVLSGHEHDQWIDVGANQLRCAAGATYDEGGQIGQFGYQWGRFIGDDSRLEARPFRFDPAGEGAWTPHEIPGVTRNGSVEKNINIDALDWASPTQDQSQAGESANNVAMSDASTDADAAVSVDGGTSIGTIVVCDVANFSDFSGDAQTDIIQCLWTLIENQDWTHLGTPKLMWGMGDTTMLVFDGLTSPRLTLDWCVDLIKALREGHHHAKLRVAIHLGPYRGFKQQGFARKQPIGKGPNDAKRLVSLGDGQHIIVSEDIIVAWGFSYDSNSRHAVQLSEFHPDVPEHPIEAFIKDGIGQKFRVYMSGLNDEPPATIRQLDVADSLLRSPEFGVLRDVEEYMLELLNEVGFSKDPGTRISIFAPIDHDDGQLYCTDFRYEAKSEKIGRSHTAYAHRPVPEGPIGVAFATNMPVVMAGLPQWVDDQADTHRRYIKKYNSEAERLGAKAMDEQRLRAFGRKARCFISIPIGIEDDRPDAVVCIDTLDPLTAIRKPRRERLAQTLHLAYRIPVAAIWRLRV